MFESFRMVDYMIFSRKCTFIQLYIMLILIINAHSQPESITESNNWIKIGRGEVVWNENSVIIRDCILQSKDTLCEPFQMSFEARALKGEAQVQIWAGAGMLDRDNRYMLGLRGGNNDDLFLRRRKTLGKDKLLALQPLDFKPQTDTWYKIRIAFWKGNIGVFIKDETVPRIYKKDDDPLIGGAVYLGGGWIKTEYRNIEISRLTEDVIKKLEQHRLRAEDKKSAGEKAAQRASERKS